MEFVHKCAAMRQVSAVIRLHIVSVAMLSVTLARYNLISRCLDIVKAELAQAVVVCESKVMLVVVLVS
jgi:hypothetical protein